MRAPRRDLREVMRDEMIMRDRIAAVIREGPKTVPEIARALGAPTHETVCWVMAMRRYGMVEAIGRPNVEGYFQYELQQQAREEPQHG